MKTLESELYRAIVLTQFYCLFYVRKFFSEIYPMKVEMVISTLPHLELNIFMPKFALQCLNYE